MTYASTTTVPIERSLSEISAMLRRAGAQRIAQAEEPEAITVQFFMSDRMIRFRLPMPSMADMPMRDGRGVTLSQKSRLSRLDQAHRSKARALMLVIKAKLESIESGIEEFEQAFLANIVMADGAVLYERAQPAITHEYATGNVSTLLLAGPKG